MQNKKYLQLLGLARRAGRLAAGHDTALDSIKKRKAELLIFAADASPRLKNEMQRSADRYNINLPSITIEETMDAIHFALGVRAGVLAVNDINFASRIIELLNQEENEYGDKN